jgi:hypothetical protein
MVQGTRRKFRRSAPSKGFLVDVTPNHSAGKAAFYGRRHCINGALETPSPTVFISRIQKFAVVPNVDAHRAGIESARRPRFAKADCAISGSGVNLTMSESHPSYNWRRVCLR